MDESGCAMNRHFQVSRVYMSDKTDNHYDDDLVTQEAKPKLERPPLYKVILINDDYTPMDFVVHILEIFFSIDRENATRIMLDVHTHGKGVCGIFTHEIAETKVSLVNDYSRENQHPLLCTLEKA
jgi:ATP-dependent Clp protease adaptor protein ClpS